MSNTQSAACIVVVAAFTIQNLNDRDQAPYGVNLAIYGINRFDRHGADVVILTKGDDFLGHKNQPVVPPPHAP